MQGTDCILSFSFMYRKHEKQIIKRDFLSIDFSLK